jgi:protoporphyrinogen IX oxidase
MHFICCGECPLTARHARIGSKLPLMLWVKTFHVLFVMSWVAGLFYLPRILVNLSLVPHDSHAERERLLLMAHKLIRFSTILAVPAIALGVWLWLGYGFRGGWVHAKLVLVFLLLGYQHACSSLLKKFVAGTNKRSHVWLRFFNEGVVFLVLGILILVIVKPF